MKISRGTQTLKSQDNSGQLKNNNDCSLHNSRITEKTDNQEIIVLYEKGKDSLNHDRRKRVEKFFTDLV